MSGRVTVRTQYPYAEVEPTCTQCQRQQSAQFPSQRERCQTSQPSQVPYPVTQSQSPQFASSVRPTDRPTDRIQPQSSSISSSSAIPRNPKILRRDAAVDDIQTSVSPPSIQSRAPFQARPNDGKVALTILTQTDAELSLQQHLDLAPDILSYPRLTIEGGTEPLMMAQPVPHHATDKKRVKVYELRNNDWFDRGTGFCTAAFMQTADDQRGDPRVIVESEDHPDRLLLETKICKEDGFQKQQGKSHGISVNGIDMALSFQEADGCALIWKFVNSVQQTFQNGMVAADDSLSDDLAMEMPSTISLPPAEIGNLQEIETSMRIMSQTVNGRDALAKCIMGEDYIGKLIPLVEMAEDLESLSDLHRLCNIMKTVILLNDTAIIEHAVSDDCVLGVVGALEYDPDFPSHKANHRHWLDNQGRYKEVVPIQDDQIRRKIHQTYRLQYLKDVVLARILDDPTFSVLNSLIFFNQVDIVQHLQGNGEFLGDLFGIFKITQTDQRRKKEAVLFIQQCCAIAKNLQPPARQTLYNNFIGHGLLQVINFGLRHPDVSVRVGATDVLVSLIDHDPHMIRGTIYRQLHERQPPLTDSLIDLLLVEVDLGVKAQISDALKVLLDQGPPLQSQEAFAKANGEFPGRRPQAMQDPQHANLLDNFYASSAIRLFRPLTDLRGRTSMAFPLQQASMFTYLIEILCFFIRQHQGKCRPFVHQQDLLRRIAQLFACPEKYLRLVAIRFFRNLAGMQDEFYDRLIMEHGILEPLLDMVSQSMHRDNLLSSACVEFFVFVTGQEHRKAMNKFLVQNYRERLVDLSYMETFRNVLVLYDQTQGHTAEFYTESEEDLARRTAANTNQRMMEHIAVDQAEEDYFNTSDDEDGPESRAFDKVQPTNGSAASTLASKPLVDYPSDEEVDENADPEVLPTSGEKQDGTDGASDTSSESSSVAPPERLSEKRRREEDDDDELGKLMQNKRRNSSSAGSNASMTSSMVRRKKTFADRPNTAAPKKIAISISPSVKTGGAARSDDES
ncbi:hypothetical protein CTAM01_03226 [Colletotrichum tamarilloi]|uniref:Serine/threonine-protein phosphatase 4 regulatory subunit 3-like central domain-containing protein n=1 Tax=Colletotrichum tamarilloi TaxID=1209934 RepID=A0ABQ9RLG9_9PEZI|nr:uncharacterized protein CTAM01_03226 [Colletotrichum tamarilloi]KAK1506894.1 hypothetical protein CTAM01_03226 [Colletotrichum tamarilloi]